jgi:hypothetical protein
LFVIGSNCVRRDRDEGLARGGGRSLILFSAIFAVQTSLDVLYLIYGVDLPDGMTYAQYAHRGAYPLLVAALLAGWFVLIAFRPGGLTECHTPTRCLVQLWICFVDFRHAIADHNVRHCREIASLSDPSLETRRAPLDIAYLEQLGPPALPALHRYVDARAADNGAAHQRAAAREAIRRLEYDLDDQLSNWRGWTLARAALMHSRPLRTTSTQLPSISTSSPRTASTYSN